MTDTRNAKQRALPWLVPVLVTALVLAALYAVRPGVIENGLRSPRVWLVVAAVILTGRLAAWGIRRATGRPGLASVGSTVVVAALGIALLAPSFQQRTLDEPFPVSVGTSASAQPSPAASRSVDPLPAAPVAPSAAAPVSDPPAEPVEAEPAAPAAPAAPDSVAPAPSPVPVVDDQPRELSAGRLDGVGHSAAGRTALYTVGAATVLRFEDVDIEGSPGPYVHLVPPGARTPEGGIALGALKAERGSFSYTLPDGVDGTRGWTVLVWCRPYATPIAASDH